MLVPLQVQRLQEVHDCQLSSRQEQASAHRRQLQQLAQQERERQEELSRCRLVVRGCGWLREVMGYGRLWGLWEVVGG